MQTLITDFRQPLILGLGISGLSMVKYFVARNLVPLVVDTRVDPPALAECRRDFPQVSCWLADNFRPEIHRFDSVFVSPGFVQSHVLISYAQQHGIPIANDVDIFAQHCQATIVAVTGTNGKTTLCTMLGHALQQAGIQVCVAGNIGLPLVSLLESPLQSDVYVIELSSFQLYWQHSLQNHIGVITNIAEDHLNIHQSMKHYIAAKHRVYHQAKAIVSNLDDVHTMALAPQATHSPEHYYFGLAMPADYQDTSQVRDTNNQIAADRTAQVQQDMLCFGQQPILPVAKLPVATQHNQRNALACIATLATINQVHAAKYLASYTYPPHRCQHAGTVLGITFINDSKATNPHAAITAIMSLSKRWSNLIVIAGGDTKGNDCRDFAQALIAHCKAVVLIGKDKAYFAGLLASLPHVLADNLPKAFTCAVSYAKSHDCIVLSPGCASTDMFKDYVERGEMFMQLVEQLKETSVSRNHCVTKPTIVNRDCHA